MAANCRRLATSTSSWRFLRILPPGILLTFGRLGKTWQPPNNSPVHVKQGPSWTFQGAYVVPCLWLSCITSGWVTLSMHGIDKVVGVTKYSQMNNGEGNVLQAAISLPVLLKAATRPRLRVSSSSIVLIDWGSSMTQKLI